LHQRMCPRRGPLPSSRPELPPTFLEHVAKMAEQRTVQSQMRHRAALVLLVQQPPLVSNIEAAAQVQLPPRSVQRWRRRWATGAFALDDEPGRGRQAALSPSGPRPGEGRRLCTARGNAPTAPSAVSRRGHCPGSYRPRRTAPSQHGVADCGDGCQQTVALHGLEFSP